MNAAISAKPRRFDDARQPPPHRNSQMTSHLHETPDSNQMKVDCSDGGFLDDQLSISRRSSSSSSVITDFTENDDAHLVRHIATERVERDASADTLQFYEALVSKGRKDLSFRWVLRHDARAWMERYRSKKSAFDAEVEARLRIETPGTDAFHSLQSVFSAGQKSGALIPATFALNKNDSQVLPLTSLGKRKSAVTSWLPPPPSLKNLALVQPRGLDVNYSASPKDMERFGCDVDESSVTEGHDQRSTTGPNKKGKRNPFTHLEEQNLARYLADHFPVVLSARTELSSYTRLVERGFRNVAYEWTLAHSAKGWHNLYSSRRNWFDQQISKILKQREAMNRKRNGGENEDYEVEDSSLDEAAPSFFSVTASFYDDSATIFKASKHCTSSDHTTYSSTSNIVSRTSFASSASNTGSIQAPTIDKPGNSVKKPNFGLPNTPGDRFSAEDDELLIEFLAEQTGHQGDRTSLTVYEKMVNINTKARGRKAEVWHSRYVAKRRWFDEEIRMICKAPPNNLDQASATACSPSAGTDSGIDSDSDEPDSNADSDSDYDSDASSAASDRAYRPSNRHRSTRRGTRDHSRQESGAPVKRYWVAYTAEDDDRLATFIAGRCPDIEAGGRTAPSMYKALIEKSKTHPAEYGWAAGHSDQAWMGRYRNKRDWFDKKIARIAAQKRTEADIGGTEGGSGSASTSTKTQIRRPPRTTVTSANSDKAFTRSKFSRDSSSIYASTSVASPALSPSSGLPYSKTEDRNLVEYLAEYCPNNTNRERFAKKVYEGLLDKARRDDAYAWAFGRTLDSWRSRYRWAFESMDEEIEKIIIAKKTSVSPQSPRRHEDRGAHPGRSAKF